MRINGKDYRIPELGFQHMCQLEEEGISIYDMTQPGRKLLTIFRAFVSISTGLDAESSSAFIEQHVYGGGDFNGWMEEINKAVDTSGFFQAIQKQMEEKKAISLQDHKKKTTKKTTTE